MSDERAAVAEGLGKGAMCNRLTNYVATYRRGNRLPLYIKYLQRYEKSNWERECTVRGVMKRHND